MVMVLLLMSPGGGNGGVGGARLALVEDEGGRGGGWMMEEASERVLMSLIADMLRFGVGRIGKELPPPPDVGGSAEVVEPVGEEDQLPPGLATTSILACLPT